MQNLIRRFQAESETVLTPKVPHGFETSGLACCLAPEGAVHISPAKLLFTQTIVPA